MATAPAAKPAPQPQEIVIYSHSNLFYWWPVWACGFIMAIVTAFSGQSLAIVPNNTKPMTSQVVPGLGDDKDRRDILVVPQKTQLPRDKDKQPIEPKLHVSNSKNVGTWFCTVLLLVIFITNVPLRGLWSVIVIVTVVFVSIIFALVQINEQSIWDHIFHFLFFLDIRINMGGYLFISIILFILWFLVSMFFDKQIYMVFSPSQFKVHMEIGGGETAYDTMGMTIEKRRNDLFRHLILGFGSGDLVVKTTGAQSHTFEIPNVLSLGRRVREIEDMLRSKQVLPGN
ncbi:MAG: hypothetical protein FJ271_11725 [Planctomycetes bacterium]|nr:hypothetical protein [Planctomycetota bacterium]